MFAIVKHGGRQYRIESGSVVELDQSNLKVGDSFNFSDVIFASDDKEIYDSSSVKIEAFVSEIGKARKIKVFKKQRRTSGMRKRRGHRQNFVGVFVKLISLSK